MFSTFKIPPRLPFNFQHSQIPIDEEDPPEIARSKMEKLGMLWMEIKSRLPFESDLDNSPALHPCGIISISSNFYSMFQNLKQLAMASVA